MSLLVPETGLLFWMMLSFGIVFFILAKFAFPVITKSIEKRNNYINNSLEAAREAEKKLATINQQAHVLMEEARSEKKALLDEALEIKKRIESEAKEAAAIEVKLIKDKAMEEIEESKRRALGEIRDQIIDISVKIAGKVVNEELHSDARQQELIGRFLEEEMACKS